MNKNQHPDSIWTWKSNRRGGKASIWIPYLHDIEKVKGGKWRLTYNGGEVTIAPGHVDSIMFYGASGNLPTAFIDEMAQKRVSLLIHRRNLTMPICFLPGQRSDDTDILTKQILFRENNIRRCYIARTLVRSRFDAVSELTPVPQGEKSALAKIRSIEKIRGWEATKARRYWMRYFKELGFPDAKRRTKSPLASALDAGSMFMTGILLRWIHVHKLSPVHGYLHVRTEYMSLVYDLLEPYRYIIEEAVRRATLNGCGENDDKLTAKTLENIKHLLDETVYVPVTRQRVRRKNLLHGVVLALRAYLAGDMRRLVIPAEGRAIGGRPIKVSYTLPGAIR